MRRYGAFLAILAVLYCIQGSHGNDSEPVDRVGDSGEAPRTGPSALHALVIDNIAPAPKPADEPIDDAKTMAGALREYKFDVRREFRCNREAMRRALLAFEKRTKRAEVALLYYSGPGVQADGENYLVPVGSRCRAGEDLTHECVNLRQILAAMQSADARLNVLILDTNFVSVDLGKLEVPPRTVLVYSTTQDGVSPGWAPGENTPFVKSVLKRMREPHLSLVELFSQVALDVPAVTEGRHQAVLHAVEAEPFSFVNGFAYSVRFGDPLPAIP